MPSETALTRAGHHGPESTRLPPCAAEQPTGEARTEAAGGHAGRAGGDSWVCAVVGGVVALECLLLLARLAL